MNKIILGVSSSIAVYKALDLLSNLKKKDIAVYSILTPNAQKLISPTFFHNLSGHFVRHDYFSSDNPETMEHIRLAKECELMVIYPASANTIATLAAGLASDLLSTTALAVDCPLLIFPAMNPTMWHHPATEANIAILKNRGVEVIDPDLGEVACGDVGMGKLLDVSLTLTIIEQHLSSLHLSNSSPLMGKKVLLTLGGSRETIDPVRFIANGSSGKMGLALAQILKKKGAILELLVGNVSENITSNLGKVSYFTSTRDLLSQLKQKINEMDVLIMNAAPGDFRVKKASKKKIKSSDSLILELTKNPDILTQLIKKPNQIFVGFAAETENLEKKALAKFSRKNLDLIIANKANGVSKTKDSANTQNVGIGQSYTDMLIIDNTGVLYRSKGAEEKTEAAFRIVNFLEKKLKLI